MSLSDLTPEELEVVRTCLECVGAGDVILHDWEFHTIMGIYPEELSSVLAAWPAVDDKDEVVRLAINNSLNNLLGYPHEFQKQWESRIPVSKAEVARVFSKWRGRRISSYIDGMA
jgi:hypothetical protein